MVPRRRPPLVLVALPLRLAGRADDEVVGHPGRARDPVRAPEAVREGGAADVVAVAPVEPPGRPAALEARCGGERARVALGV